MPDLQVCGVLCGGKRTELRDILKILDLDEEIAFCHHMCTFHVP